MAEFRQACTGFINATLFAAGLCAAGGGRPVAVVGSEIGSVFFDPARAAEDFSQLVNFVQMGDGAGAVILAGEQAHARTPRLSGLYHGRSPPTTASGASFMSTPEGSPAGEWPVDVVNLRKRFGATTALADLSLQLGPGQVFGAVGANGGGKTTALRILAGLLPADAGGGRVLGVDLRAHPARLRGSVGYLTQHHPLHRDLTVGENLLARARVYAVADPRRRVAELLGQFGLERFARERVGRLSGGWGRRAQFAATLVLAPRLLLLDEPTAGLDLATSRHLWESVVELAAGGGRRSSSARTT